MADWVLDGRIARRIIALLLSIAGLAESAAQRSFPIRWVLLVLLRRAEAAALTLLVDVVPIDCSEFDDPDAGFRPVDALLLAARLRVIAALLTAVLAVPPCAHRRRTCREAAQPAVRLRLARTVGTPVALPLGAFDTS
jgi:hypothetical protein